MLTLFAYDVIRFGNLWHFSNSFLPADFDKIVKVYVSQSFVSDPSFVFFYYVAVDLIDFVKYVDVLWGPCCYGNHFVSTYLYNFTSC